MSFKLINSQILLGGNQHIVHVDEIYVLRRKYNRGRYKPQIWSLDRIYVLTKKAFLVIVPDKTRQTLFNIIFDKVLSGTQINTYCFNPYRTLSMVSDSDRNNFCKHYTFNHSENFVDPITNMHTNNIKCFLVILEIFCNKCSRKDFI